MADFIAPYYANLGGGAVDNRSAGNLLVTLSWAYRETMTASYYNTMVQCLTAMGPSSSWAVLSGMYPAGLGEFLRLKTDFGQVGDAHYNQALANLQANSDYALGQSGADWPYIFYVEALCLASRYAPSSNPNKAAYKAKAGQIWNQILPSSSAYPSAKPLSYWISQSHVWPYFDQGGL